MQKLSAHLPKNTDQSFKYNALKMSLNRSNVNFHNTSFKLNFLVLAHFNKMLYCFKYSLMTK